jgi:hypothetical protein
LNLANALPLLAALCTCAVNAKDLSCKSEVRFGQDGALQVQATLRRSGSTITGIEIESTTVVFPTYTGYSCSVEFDQEQTNVKWAALGEITRVSGSTDDPAEKSEVSIRRTAQGYLIDPRGLSRITCGARGQWPASILIPFRGSRCTTKY